MDNQELSFFAIMALVLLLVHIRPRNVKSLEEDGESLIPNRDVFGLELGEHKLSAFKRIPYSPYKILLAMLICLLILLIGISV